jgi:coatomer subunit beta'
LALQLDDLDAALEIVRAVPDAEAETKWKAVGDRALTVWRFDLARECFEKAGDLNALMLLLLSTGDKAGLRQLATKAGRSIFRFSRMSCSNIYHQSKGAKTT